MTVPPSFRPAVDRVRRPLRALVGRFHPRHLALWFRFVASVLGSSLARRREPRLSVGIDITPLWESLSGIGWYLDRLLRELSAHPEVRFRLYGPTVIASADLEAPVVDIPVADNVEWVRAWAPSGMPFTTTTVKLLRRIQPLLIALDGNQLLFAPNFFLPRRMRWARGRLVATIHDLGWQKVPWTLSEATRRNLERHVPGVLRRATRLITPSEAVRAELIESGVGGAKIVAIHHGPGQLAGAGAADRQAAAAPFALFVGTLEPRKGVGTLLEAWRRVRAAGGDPPKLILVGRWGWKSEELRAEADVAAAEGWCAAPGYVTRQELQRLYSAARFVALPSVYEGFGLPLLEAMYAGAPILSSDLPVTREVAGDAAIYAAAGDPVAWAAAVDRLSREPDLLERLSRAGRERARDFRWEEAARRTVEVLKAAAAARIPGDR
mgnify:CR=1 FL=1